MVKRGNTKGVLSVTIDNSLLDEFREKCKKNSINKSQLIESYIQEYVKKNG